MLLNETLKTVTMVTALLLEHKIITFPLLLYMY